MRVLYAALFGLLLCGTSACQSAEGPVETKEESSETTPAVAAPSPANTPLQVLGLPVTDSLPYPIVADFAELEPIFARKDGKTYVINFWATWCGPCVEELPYFEQLAAETDPEEVEIVLVSLDFRRDVRTKLLKFVRERPLDLPVIALTDTKTNVWIDKVDSEWGGAIPITIVYKNDERRFFADQFANYEELATAVRSIQ